MPEGTSWLVQGTARGASGGRDGARIRLALERGDVRWDDRTSAWLAKNFDRTKYNQRIVNGILRDHVLGGGPVKGQWSPEGENHPCWFAVNLEIDGIERFIKFEIEPEDDEDPGLLIRNAHPPY